MAGYFDGTNTFYIGEFDGNVEELAMPLTRVIKNQAERVDGHVDLFITSYGGNADVCQHFVELVEIGKAHGVTMRTIVPSAAYSAGSYLAVAGTKGERYIGRSAQHLVHYGQIGGASSTPTQQERNGAYHSHFFKQTLSHYKKYCDIPDLEKHLSDDGFFILANKCLRWGLADKYLDKYQFIW